MKKWTSIVREKYWKTQTFQIDAFLIILWVKEKSIKLPKYGKNEFP